MTKRCGRCGEEKPLEEFSPSKQGKLGRYSYCRPCHSKDDRARAAKKKAADPQAYYLHQRDLGLRKKYGITLAEFEELLELQNNVCAICKKPANIKARRKGLRVLHVDHSHKTGKRRGLLCHMCNYILLGRFGNIELLRNAADYLERNEQ